MYHILSQLVWQCSINDFCKILDSPPRVLDLYNGLQKSTIEPFALSQGDSYIPLSCLTALRREVRYENRRLISDWTSFPVASFTSKYRAYLNNLISEQKVQKQVL